MLVSWIFRTIYNRLLIQKSFNQKFESDLILWKPVVTSVSVIKSSSFLYNIEKFNAVIKVEYLNILFIATQKDIGVIYFINSSTNE